MVKAIPFVVSQFKLLPWDDQRFLDRFWGKVALTPNPLDCWLWTAGLSDLGYGKFRIKDRWYYAHRMALEIELQAFLAENVNANHVRACPHRHCCNPAHIYPGSQKQNMDDMAALGRCMVAKINRAKTSCPRGHPYDMRNSKGSRSCRACQRLAEKRCIARRLAGLTKPTPGQGRPKTLACTHAGAFDSVQGNGAVECTACRSLRRKAVRDRKREGLPQVKPLV